jgi:hypothetical protein
MPLLVRAVLVRAVLIRADDECVLSAWCSGTSQGKQKCLMYATNFALSASEQYDLHKTAQLRTKPLA